MKAAERAAITRGRKQIVLMLGTVVTFFFACLLPFKVREDKDTPHHIFEKFYFTKLFKLRFIRATQFFMTKAHRSVAIINKLFQNTAMFIFLFRRSGD